MSAGGGEGVRRSLRLELALAAPLSCLLLLEACSSGVPAPPPLPTRSDWSGERSCECLAGGRCAIPEAAEGESEIRAFQCRRQGHDPRRALCSLETRFKPTGPARAGWSAWSTTRLDFTHLGDKGWCWTPAAESDP